MPTSISTTFLSFLLLLLPLYFYPLLLPGLLFLHVPLGMKHRNEIAGNFPPWAQVRARGQCCQNEAIPSASLFSLSLHLSSLSSLSIPRYLLHAAFTLRSPFILSFGISFSIYPLVSSLTLPSTISHQRTP